MNKQRVLTKICICLLTAVVVLSAGVGAEKTGAWFTDSGLWVEAEYGVGVIDYTVHVNGESLEKIKNGQNVSLTVPITGGARLSDGKKTVAPVTVSRGGEEAAIGEHDEFDEAVTLIRARIVNIGGLPVGIRATINEQTMFSNGMLYMVLPQTAELDADQFSITSGGVTNTYRDYIVGKLGAGAAGTFAQLSGAVKTYHEGVTDGLSNSTVAYPGKLPSYKNAETADKAFEINVLCWAEYDKQPWSAGDDARNNANPVSQQAGRLVLTIESTL